MSDNQNNDLKTTNTDMGFGALENKSKINDNNIVIEEIEESEEEQIISEKKNEKSFNFDNNNLNIDSATSDGDIDDEPIHQSIKRNTPIRLSPKKQSPRKVSPIRRSPKKQSPNISPINSEHKEYESYNPRRRYMKPGEEEMSPDDEYVEKIKLLAKMDEMSDQIRFSRKYSIDDDFYEIRFEYDLKKTLKDKKNGVQLAKGFLMNAVSAIEFLNDQYDPFDFKLKGWTENLNCDMESYNDVLGELYEKYRSKGKKVAPEIKLLMMLSSSAVQFHLSKTLFSGPGLENVLNNNPDLLQKLMKQNNNNNNNNNNNEQMEEMKRMYEEKINKMKKQKEESDDEEEEEVEVLQAPKNSQEILQTIMRQQQLKKSGSSKRKSRRRDENMAKIDISA